MMADDVKMIDNNFILYFFVETFSIKHNECNLALMDLIE